MLIVNNPATIALAMAGGSFRAASTCGGILRGLHQKTIEDCNGNTVPAMDAVKFNSGISGGSIPAVLYSYAQVPTEDLLETHRSADPADITLKDLKHMPKTSYGYTLIKKDPNFFLTVFGAIGLTNPIIVLFFSLFNITTIKSWWTTFMYVKLCKPLKMKRDRYFTSCKEEMEQIIKRNPMLSEKDFLLPREDIKTKPLILWSVHGRRRDIGRFTRNFQKIKEEAWDEFQRSQALSFVSGDVDDMPSMNQILLEKRDLYDGNVPVPYLGTPDEVFSPYEGEVYFGGKTNNEPIAFPLSTVKPFEWGSGSKFSIETMMALSTNFAGTGGLQENVEDHVVAQLASNVRHINVSNDHGNSEDREETLLVADGGTNDLMGILPAIQQKADKIVSIYNFNQNPPHANFQTPYSEIYKKAPSTSRNDPNFCRDFREWLKYINPRITCYFGYFGQSMIPQANIANHVFDDEKLEHLKDLMIKFNSLYEAGEPLVATMEGLETIDNPFWGIEGGNKVDLTLIWFNLPRRFSERVPDHLGLGLDEDGHFTNDKMKMVHFPELLNSPTDSMGYKPEQINMMSYLGSWIVHQAWDGLKGHDGEVKFEGFKKIFESAGI